MKCPIDQQKLAPKDTEGHTGFFCATCSGAWLPEKFVSSIKYSKNFDPEILNAKLKSIVTFKSKLECPQNCSCLDVVKLDNLEIDWCPNCNGIWFDKGELLDFLNKYPSLNTKQEFKARDMFEIIASIFLLSP